MNGATVVVCGLVLACGSARAEPVAELGVGVGTARLPHSGVQSWFPGLGLSGAAGARLSPTFAVQGRATVFAAQSRSVGIAVAGLLGPELLVWMHPRAFLGVSAGAGRARTNYTGSPVLGVDARAGVQLRRGLALFVEVTHMSRLVTEDYTEWHTVTAATAQLRYSLL